MPSLYSDRRLAQELRTAKRDPSAAYLEARVYLLARKAAKRRQPYVGKLVGNVNQNHKAGGT